MIIKSAYLMHNALCFFNNKLICWLKYHCLLYRVLKRYGKTVKGSTRLVWTYRFLAGEGSAALVKNGQGRTDRAGHRRAIFRITRNSKDIDIASAKLTVLEMYANATRSKCMLNY